MKRFSRIIVFLIIVGLLFGLVGITSSNITQDITLGLDLQGGYEILYQVIPSQEGQTITRDLLLQTQAALQKRVDVIGVTEPEFRIEGEDRIRVKLAGVTDHEQARRMLASEAHLSFRDVHDQLLMGGDNIVEGSARVLFNEMNQPYVVVKFKDQNLTRDVTTRQLNQPMVIWLDWEEGDSFAAESGKANPKFISAPTVQNILTSEGTIKGSYSYNEAKELADLLNAGALPVTLEELSANGVGAKLGEQAMNLAVKAGFIGMLLILIYMLIYYRLPGAVAAVTIVGYVYMILLVFKWMQATLTLPGIAALVLGVGMAVDANILTYERMKEEIRLGKSILSAFKLGSKRALATIMDANITSVIAAVVLFYFGSSAIQGFAVMLITSIIVSMLTAVFGTRLLLGLLVQSKVFDNKHRWFGVKEDEIGKLDEKQENRQDKKRLSRLDFVQHRRKYFAVSGIVIGLGLLFLVFSGLNLGVDFTGGTQIEMMSSDHTLVQSAVEETLQQVGLTAGEIRFAGDNNEIVRLLFQEHLTKDQEYELDQAFMTRYGDELSISETTVSADVARELARQAICAVILTFGGILLYVAIRFEFQFALAGIIALFHAPFITVIAVSLFRVEVDLTFIAALLTIVGYSINDTIVIFDRLRENLKTAKIKHAGQLSELVNQSIRDTLARSINTLLTVLFAAVALYLFGGEGIRNFSFALFIGLSAGAYSSIFIAAQTWLVLKGRELKKKGFLNQAEAK